MDRMLIIGASRGLGAGLAGEHLARGWHVTATARGAAPELEPLRQRHPDRLAIERCDIRAAADVHGLAGRLAGSRFDLLFLNAGIMLGRGVPLSEVPDADVADIFLTNAVAPVRAADALIGTVAPGGTVAFMSSILGSIATNEDGRAELYRASKAALNSLVRSFRARHTERPITVLALHPGVVRTAMGGPSAPLDITTSVKGVADVLMRRRGTGGVAFVDWRGEVIPW